MYHFKIKTLLIITLILIAWPSFASELNGNWRGDLVLPNGQSIELIFHIQTQNGLHTASLDVPAQKQFGLEFNHVELKANRISLALDLAGIKYSAEINAGRLLGTYQQGGFSAPLNLSKLAANSPQAKSQRVQLPQEPVGELPYEQFDVTFFNKAQDFKLAGSLSLPKGQIQAAAILLSGSGPTNQDADAFGHKLFLVLADLLTRRGIAVLRYDDRGVGKSGGDYASATSADFAQDALAAQTFLQQFPRLKQSQIGFIGHSEGGLIGAIAGANNAELDFLVMLAGPGTSGAQILIDQSYHMQKLQGLNTTELAASDLAQREIMQAVSDDADSNNLVRLMLKHGMDESQANAQVAQLMSPWFRYFVKTQPAEYLAKVSAPILALNGELDSQVLADVNLAGILQATGNRATVKKLSGLNHLFQPAVTGLPSEYSESSVTFSESSVDEISKWITTLK